MVSVFGTLFSLDIQHTFYTNKLCEDFSVVPTSATAERIRRHQAVFRFSGNSGAMLQKFASGSIPPLLLPFDSGSTLDFAVYLNSPSLFNITQTLSLTQTGGFPSSPKKALLFSNTNNTFAATPPELTKKEISICGLVLTHYIVSSSAITLTLKNEEGTLITSKTYAAGSNGKEFNYDLQSISPGLYTVTETAGMTGTDYNYFADDEVNSDKPFGIIRITQPSVTPFLFAGNEKYRITFAPSDSIWRYFIVAPNFSAADMTSLTIRDQGRSGPAQIIFNRNNGTDPVKTVLETVPGKVAMFQSQSRVLWQQATRKQIELRKGASTIIGNLSNPDSRKPGSDIIIHV